MSKSRKLLLGILSCLPIGLLVVYIFTFFRFFLALFRHAQQEYVVPPLIMENIIWMVLVMIVMVLCTMGLLIYFIIHAVNSKVIDSTERIIWILVFIFAGMVGFPVYWYLRIWKKDA